MGSVSSEIEDSSSERCCGSYSLSADISECESSTTTTITIYDVSSTCSNITPSSPFLFPLVAANAKEPDSEVEMMKQRFAKLLLGEDMSGGGKGVSTALAISNAITNLSATVFGQLWRLEPLLPENKAIWRREMEWMLCVSDSIVELEPSLQKFPGGGTCEVMATRPRSDLYVNLPALKKIDAMLISILDGFQDLELSYADTGGDAYSSDIYGGRPSVRQEDKWWLPYPKVPPKGLSTDARKQLQQCRDCTNQIYKAALAIDSNVLADMEIPSAYLDTLPKNGKDCLGNIIYRYITADQFSPEGLLDSLDLSSEHHTLDVVNRVEAAIHVWNMKDGKIHTKLSKTKRSSLSGKVQGLVTDGEKNHFLALRAESLLRCVRLRFPSLPQTTLDMNKIQYNEELAKSCRDVVHLGETNISDVGQSILESYSRVMESLAFNIMSRVDDVLYVDDAAKKCADAKSKPFFSRQNLGGLPIQKRLSPSPFSIQHTTHTTPFATPFCSSPPITRSPGRSTTPINTTGLKRETSHKSEILLPADLDKLWSYSGSLGARRISTDDQERD